MLVGARHEAAADVVIAVEDDAALADALRALAALRRAGLSGEIVATGSPRKRYDKATKIPAKVIAGLSLADGALRWRLRGDDAVQAALRAVLPEPGSA
jgi:histidyl-tRNA synthetase